MSGALGKALASPAGAIAGQLVNILIKPLRQIGNIYPNVVLQERGTDTLEITRQPVEKTADITDHAFQQPAECVIQARWSDSSIQAIASLFTGGDILGVLTDGAFGSMSYSRQQYNLIRGLQASRIPFTVVTGKRRYVNMLMARVVNVTDRYTEYSLALDITCREVILVSTQSTILPPAMDQANPQQTSSPTASGTNQPSDANNNSTLLNLAGSSAQSSVQGGMATLGGVVKGIGLPGNVPAGVAP